jgi:hypothetical protein
MAPLARSMSPCNVIIRSLALDGLEARVDGNVATRPTLGQADLVAAEGLRNMHRPAIGSGDPGPRRATELASST